MELIIIEAKHSEYTVTCTVHCKYILLLIDQSRMLSK